MVKEVLVQAKNILMTHRKKIGAAIVTVIVLGAISAGAHAMFQVKGVVTGVDSNSITVANFFRTQTVDLTGTAVNISGIKTGDRIMIQKNLQGNVLYARILTGEHGEHRHNAKEHQTKDKEHYIN